ncbi:MAG TPA: TetR family transcriptional regulator [Candidatus Limnocylindrales bacterium]|nr:TetR family transcriptional regulator [Candidatus Limnocylindrales bacterium]
MPRLTAAHEQEVRDRIVAASLRVFGERGFHGATMQDVVRESGLSVGAIYTHFRGKDELFMAACDLASGRGLGELAARVAAGRTTVEKLAIAVAFFFDAAEGDERANLPGNAEFLVQAWAQADAEPAAREMLVRRREQLVMAGSMLLEEGIARGELPAWLDTTALARAYVAMLDGLLLARVEQGGAWRRPEAERQAREILSAVLAAAAQPDRPVVGEVAPRPYSLVEPDGPGDSAAS